jgi:hypothetical protein
MKGNIMKKFLVKFVDSITGQVREDVVEGETRDKVRETQLSALRKVLSVVLM